MDRLGADEQRQDPRSAPCSRCATLKLPLGIEVTLNQGAEIPLRQLFAGDGGVDIRISGPNAYLQCARDRKVAVLGALSSWWTGR